MMSGVFFFHLQTLQYVERTSPECVLHLGVHLNAPFHAQLPSKTEDDVKDEMLAQQAEEVSQLSAHGADTRCIIITTWSLFTRDCNKPSGTQSRGFF